MWLFLALLAVPIIEIALFIRVGGLIGLGPTLAIVLATAILGSWLIRRQGIGALMQLRQSVGALSDPTRPLFDGAAIILAGVLLLTPGFLTDATGLVLLVPGVRGALYAWLRARITVVAVGGSGPGPAPGPQVRDRGEVIEGEFSEVPPKRQD